MSCGNVFRKAWTRSAARILAVVMTLLLAVTMMPMTRMPYGSAFGVAAKGTLTTESPELVVTGTKVIGGAAYKKDNISYEKAYTRAELKAMEGGKDIVYSSINTNKPEPSKKLYKATGVYLTSLLKGTAFNSTKDKVTILATDNYKASFDPDAKYQQGSPMTTGLNEKRYYYPNFESGSAAGAEEVQTMIAWAYAEKSGGVPDAADEKTNTKMITGQLSPEDQNNPLYNGGKKAIDRIIGGDPLEETALTVGNKTYTRAQVLLMDRADNTYTYTTQKGETTDYVRGVPLAVFLSDCNDTDTVTFDTADNVGVDASGMTVKELIENDYILAYEKGTQKSDLNGIYATARNDDSVKGYFTLYGKGKKEKPAKLVNKITVTTSQGIDYSKSPYKHITNGGITGQDGPYDIDGITGATLTVEGPGVKKSVPLSVRDLESKDAGAHRGDYTDYRGTGQTKTDRTYEGIDLYYLLHNMQNGETGIILTDKAKKVEIKNRNRRTIATIPLEEIKAMHDSGNPVLVSYGTSYTDGTNAKPFVFDGGSGGDDKLGNEDGCLKLVYDQSRITGNADYKTFSNMAYIYVSEEDEPGYKHDKDPYKTAENSQYVLTVTGSEIGREVNYTVQQLEDMVEYDADNKPKGDGMGWRDEYSLANSNYWYVNEYEGVQLWKLLQKSGLPEAKKADEKTKVTFTTTDGYKDIDNFTLKEVADPNCFGFYEKNAKDGNDGKYQGTADDLKRKGFPVLVAYGVNRYPYVSKKELDGYLSGLENDGGPLRIIAGKKDYQHSNGSRQAKLLDKVVAGDDTHHYSTHKYHDNKVYKDLADSAKINVKVLNGTGADAPELSNKSYSVGELEELIYGGSLTKNELSKAKIKDFYEVGKGEKYYSDLYEGIDLSYFLEDVVQLPGAKGTITFTDASGNAMDLNLADVLSWKDGYNDQTKLNDLKPVLAYAKNGAPMVASKNAEDGYEGTITLAEGTDYKNEVKIKNNGGPLQVIFPRASKNAEDKPQAQASVASITVNLAADNYAHTKAPYDTYKDDTLKISGEGTRLTGEKTFKVSELEGRQTLAKTGDYSILKNSGTTDQQRYRGISLYGLLKSTSIGLKNNADKVIVTAKDGSKKEFTLSEVMKSDYMNSVTEENNLSMILAYGASGVDNPNKEDGKPLVTDKDSPGYEAGYKNDGGPLKLVMGQKDKEDINSGKIMKNVASIEVTASEMTSWNHSSSEVFKQYLTDKLTLQVEDKEGKSLFNKDYTIAEMEAMTDLIEREEITSTGDNTWEGINLWGFVLQEAGKIKGIDAPISVTAFAKDGANRDLRAFGLDALKDGIKDGERYVPILLAYGKEGYPLASGGKSSQNGPGYDSMIDNNGGPLRLMTHLNQGACLSETNKIVVKVGEGGTDPQPQEKDFNIYGLKEGTVSYDIKGLKNSGAASGVVTGTYKSKEGSDYVRGIYLSELLETKGITNKAATIDITTTDGYAPKDYKDITLKDLAEQKYLIAYDTSSDNGATWSGIKDTSGDGKTTATVRIYRNYDDGSKRYNRMDCVKGVTVHLSTAFNTIPADGSEGNLPTAGVRSISIDDDGGLWVGTYGGGAAYKAKDAKAFTIYNKTSKPALESATISAIAADSQGGVWMTQNSSYSEPDKNKGIAYMKDGKVDYYRTADKPATIPNDYVQEIQIDDQGIVWFGSFGGLTKYDPKKQTWTTWDKKDGFPAMSIDNLTFDGEGGAWCGFYPDGAGTKAEPFQGGFAHIDKNGKITKYDLTADYDEQAASSKLAQVWIRDIAVDAKGGAWVVASGSYADMENTGGRVWYVSSPGAKPAEYTGDQLFGKALDGAGNAELRMVMADPDGGLWFGTSADGVFYVKDPAVNKDGSMAITAEYSKETGSWDTKNMNNIYSLDLAGSTVYVGSSAGLAYLDFEFKGTDSLSALKEKAVKELKSYANLNDYRSKQQQEVKAAIAAGEKAISAASTETNVKKELAAAKAAIDAIRTKAQFEAAELEVAKDMAKSELTTYKSMTVYRAAERQALITLVLEGKQDIDKAKNIEAVNSVLKAVKAKIDKLKTAAQLTSEEQIAAMRKTLSKKVSVSAASASYKSVKLKWTKIKGASGYMIYQSTKKTSGFKKIKTVTKATSTTYTKSSLQTGKTYYYKVRAYGKASGKTLYGNLSAAKAVRPMLNTPVVKVKAKSSKAVIQWKRVAGANGYTIYRSVKKTGKYVVVGKISKGSKVSYTNIKLKKGKKYYYKMRAYKKIDGKKVYSKYSAIKSVKAK